MVFLDQVQRGIDYIETNLEFDIQSADVARHAGRGCKEFCVD
jgi:hypothetical protein